jgi:hypothetical protein
MVSMRMTYRDSSRKMWEHNEQKSVPPVRSVHLGRLQAALDLMIAMLSAELA